MKIQEQMIENAIVQCIALDNPVGALTFLELYTQLKLNNNLEIQPTIDITDEDIAFMSCEALEATTEEEDTWASWEYAKTHQEEIVSEHEKNGNIVNGLEYGISDEDVKIFLYRYSTMGLDYIQMYMDLFGDKKLDRMKLTIERKKHLGLKIAGVPTVRANFLSEEVVEMIKIVLQTNH